MQVKIWDRFDLYLLLFGLCFRSTWLVLWDRSFVLLPCWPSFGLLFACTLSLYLFADFRPFFAVDLGLEQPLNYNTTCNCCIGLQVVGFQD